MTPADADSAPPELGADTAGASGSKGPPMRFAHQAALTFATQAAVQGLTLATQIIMPRIIPPEAKGPADAVLWLSLPMIVLGNLGLASAILYHPDRKHKSLDTVASTALTTALVWGALLAGACAFVLPNYFSSRHPSMIAVWHVGLILATTPLQLATSYLNVTQIVAGRIVGFNVIQFLPTFLYVGTFFGLYLGIGPQRFAAEPMLFLTSMVVARVAQWTISSITAVALLRRVATFAPRIDWKYLLEALKFGSRPYLRDVFQVLTLNFSFYYLDWIGTPAEELGFFSTAASAMVALWQVPEAIHMVLANRLATLHPEDRRWLTPIVCRNIFAATVLVAVAIGLLAEAIFRFWAPRYMGSVASLRALLAGSAIFSLYKVLQTDLLARGYKNAVPALAGMCLGLLVLSTCLLIGLLGHRHIVVAAACASGAMGITGIATVLYYCRTAGQPIWKMVVLQREDLRLWGDLLGKRFRRSR